MTNPQARSTATKNDNSIERRGTSSWIIKMVADTNVTTIAVRLISQVDVLLAPGIWAERQSSRTARQSAPTTQAAGEATTQMAQAEESWRAAPIISCTP